MSLTHLLTPGRTLMLANNLFLCSGAFYFDWSKSHVLNPRWPPHARFHNGQTMTMALLYLLFATYYLARGPGGKLAGASLQLNRENVWAAALVGSMYAVAGVSAAWYPGALWLDPEFGGPDEKPQFYMFTGSLIVNWIGYFIEMGRLGN